jgi:hypothetical protein
MSESIEKDLAELDSAIRAQRLRVHIGKEAVERLLTTAFRGPDIIAQFNEQVRMRGESRAIAIAQGRDDLPRAMWFGRLNGSAWNREERIQAEAALAELPNAIADLKGNELHLRDLEAARDRVARMPAQERQNHNDRRNARQPERPRENQNAHKRGTGHSRGREGG